MRTPKFLAFIHGALAFGPGDNRMAEQPVRRRLMSLISNRPGIHASELSREMDESWSTVQYHLSLLRQADMVDSVEAGRERRFFPSGVDPSTARMVSLMTQGRRSEIAQFIQANPGSRQVEICESLGVSRKTFRNSVRPLIEEGLMQEKRSLQSNRYFAAPSLDPYMAGAEEIMDPSLS